MNALDSQYDVRRYFKESRLPTTYGQFTRKPEIASKGVDVPANELEFAR